MNDTQEVWVNTVSGNRYWLELDDQTSIGFFFKSRNWVEVENGYGKVMLATDKIESYNIEEA